MTCFPQLSWSLASEHLFFRLYNSETIRALCTCTVESLTAQLVEPFGKVYAVIKIEQNPVFTYEVVEAKRLISEIHLESRFLGTKLERS